MEAMAMTPTKERAKEAKEQKERMQQTFTTNVVAMPRASQMCTGRIQELSSSWSTWMIWL